MIVLGLMALITRWAARDALDELVKGEGRGDEGPRRGEHERAWRRGKVLVAAIRERPTYLHRDNDNLTKIDLDALSPPVVEGWECVLGFSFT